MNDFYIKCTFRCIQYVFSFNVYMYVCAVLIFSHPVRGRNLSDEIPQHQLQQSSDDKDGEDAFAIQHGHMKAGLGVRPSRSYDMLTNMSVEVDREGMVVLSSSVDCSRSFVGGASPK